MMLQKIFIILQNLQKIQGGLAMVCQLQKFFQQTYQFMVVPIQIIVIMIPPPLKMMVHVITYVQVVWMKMLVISVKIM